MSAAYTAARADTDITTDNKSAQTTSTDGNISIEQGGQVDIKASTSGGDDQFQQFADQSRQHQQRQYLDRDRHPDRYQRRQSGDLDGHLQRRRPRPVRRRLGQGGAGRYRRQYLLRSDQLQRDRADHHAGQQHHDLRGDQLIHLRPGRPELRLLFGARHHHRRQCRFRRQYRA